MRSSGERPAHDAPNRTPCAGSMGLAARGLASVLYLKRMTPHASDLKPGEVVDRDFVVDEVVGRGSFSTVYRSRQRSRKDRIVAVKVLHKGMQNEIERLAGHVRNPYLKEQMLCHRLKDPTVCRVIKVGRTDDGRYFAAMEWAEGTTLEHYLRDRETGMDLHVVAAVLDPITRALSEMHLQRVIHRDIKPSNIILRDTESSRPRVKILDFGVAKILDEDDTDLGATDLLVGTPAYMSPEQAATIRTDTRTDIFSLGAITYEMITGRRHIQVPRNASDGYTDYLLDPALPVPTVPADAIRSDLPEGLSMVLDAALDRDPNNRPPTVEIFFDTIDPLLRSAARRGSNGTGIISRTIRRLRGRTDDT